MDEKDNPVEIHVPAEDSDEAVSPTDGEAPDEVGALSGSSSPGAAESVVAGDGTDGSATDDDGRGGTSPVPPAVTDEERRGKAQVGTERLASRVYPRSEGHVPADPVPGRENDKPAYSGYNRVADDAPMLLLISGSPRRRNCVSLVDIIERGARDAGVRTQRFLLSDKRIDPCIGCDGCARTGACVLANRTTPEGGFADDYLELTGLLDSCDGLAVVAPVYFSGPPAQLKALYDRFQPYWVRKYLLHQPFPVRRPSQLFVVGTGGDPHGFDPFVTISRSCLQIAGFELEKVGNYLGYVAPRDVPARPTAEDAKHMNAKELADANAAIDVQENFQRMAYESGTALGRMLWQDVEARNAAMAEAEDESAAAGVLSAEESAAKVEAAKAAARATVQATVSEFGVIEEGSADGAQEDLSSDACDDAVAGSVVVSDGACCEDGACAIQDAAAYATAQDVSTDEAEPPLEDSQDSSQSSDEAPEEEAAVDDACEPDASADGE